MYKPANKQHNDNAIVIQIYSGGTENTDIVNIPDSTKNMMNNAPPEYNNDLSLAARSSNIICRHADNLLG